MKQYDTQARVPAGSSAGGQFAGSQGGSGAALAAAQNKEWAAMVEKHKREKAEAMGGSHELWTGTLRAHATEKANMAERHSREEAAASGRSSPPSASPSGATVVRSSFRRR